MDNIQAERAQLPEAAAIAPPQEEPQKKKRKKMSVGMTVLIVIYFIYAATLLFPILWLIYNSLKNKVEFSANPWAFPESPFLSLKNYGVIFSQFNVGSMFFNSVILATLMPLINLFFCACTAYAYAMHEFHGKRALYWLAIIPMFVAITGTLPAQYKLYIDLGIYDNMIGILLTATGGFGFAFLLFAGVFQNVSRTYKEAAEIDGAGQWRTFLQIYLPQIGGVFGAQWLLGFIGNWNDYMMPYLFLPSHQTLSVGIYYISDRVTNGFSDMSGDYPKLFAAMLVTIIPCIVLFTVFQKKIINFTMAGGIKG